jgi:hypothetical protein
MARFAVVYPNLPIVQQTAAQLPWGHTMLLLDKVKGSQEREWYGAQALEHGWSRDVLALQIRSHLFQRQITTTKTTNFSSRLPPPQSDMAVDALKDPYVLDFLGLGDIGHRDCSDVCPCHHGVSSSFFGNATCHRLDHGDFRNKHKLPRGIADAPCAKGRHQDRPEPSTGSLVFELRMPEFAKRWSISIPLRPQLQGFQ